MALRSLAVNCGMLLMIFLVGVSAASLWRRSHSPSLDELGKWALIALAIGLILTIAEQIPLWRDRISIKPKRK